MTLADATTQAAEIAAIDGAYASIENYYTKKILAHGATPNGVDWESQATQEMRFVQLLRICDFSEPFSLNDLGCGYGALLSMLRKRHRTASINYLGIDVSDSMVSTAKRRWASATNANFIHGREAPRIADYSVASGIFNVKLNQPLDTWTALIERTLHHLNAVSRVAFSVNFLAHLPPGSNCPQELYCADPCQWAEFCSRTLGARVEVLDNYGMREFTLHAFPCSAN